MENVQRSQDLEEAEVEILKAEEGSSRPQEVVGLGEFVKALWRDVQGEEGEITTLT